jgi:glycosyltransferase involved in cell wall biosynthesis
MAVQHDGAGRGRDCFEPMMHLFINSLAASAGGGLTYIRNVLPHLALQPSLRVTVILTPGLREEFRGLGNIDFMEPGISQARRFWYEQTALPEVIRSCGANILLSTGNVALRKSPVPQILLSRNSVYVSPDFYRDLRSRSEYRMWLDTHLRGLIAKRSIRWADATVAPSQAFADDLCRWTSVRVLPIHHGFDREAFVRDSSRLAVAVEEKLRGAETSLKILFVSHYNYYRNFETLIRALPLLRDRLAGRSVRLLLTCNLAAGKNPGSYRPEHAAELVKKLGVADLVVELGSIPYGQLHQVYRRADVYATPAYTETFAHPLVESMACGIPVVASDIPVHREICGDAAMYFQRFSAEELAGALAQVAASQETSRPMAIAGLERSKQFSWKNHVDEILQLCHSLLDSKSSSISAKSSAPGAEI